MPHLRRSRWLAIELGLVLAAFCVYAGVAQVARRHGLDADSHTRQLTDLERPYGLWERPVEDAVAAIPGLRSGLEVFYLLGYWPFLVGVLAWLGSRHRETYARLRTTMLASGAVGALVFLLFPVAPPSALGDASLSDVSPLESVLNPYAAFPSMHVAWSLLAVAAACQTCSSHFVRATLVLQPVLMIVAVTAGKHHLLIDSGAGIALALLFLGLSAVTQAAHEARGDPVLAATRPAGPSG